MVLVRYPRLTGIVGAALLALRIFILSALGAGGLCVAQDQETLTLHAYANRIQIPVLVLNSDRKRIARSVAERISVRIDSGPPFRPEHIRREGDDPISLAIVLDTGLAQADLLAKIDEAIAELAPALLGSRDRVSIYALDCYLIRSSNSTPPGHQQLKDAVDRALQAWNDSRRTKRAKKCQHGIYLWDGLSLVTHEISTYSGRRVVLAVSNGRDGGSTIRWNDLRTYAQANGVAVFGLTYTSDRFSGANDGLPVVEDPFRFLCELTGGMDLTATRFDVKDQLKWFITMLRERYIIEFARPWNATVGQHDLAVAVDGKDYFVRTSGISVSIADPAIMTDPTTVPSDPSRTPTLGSRRPLTSPR